MARACMLEKIENVACYLHFWHAISTWYATIMSRNRGKVIIWSTLNWLYLISTEKRTWQTVTIDKNNCNFSVVYSLLKMKSKAYIFENVLNSLKYVVCICLGIGFFSCFILIVWNIWSGRKNHVGKKMSRW